jgi:hypothetical protein
MLKWLNGNEAEKQNDTAYCITERQCGVGTKDELREGMAVEEKL